MNRITISHTDVARSHGELWGAIDAYVDAVAASKGDRGSSLAQIVAKELNSRLDDYVRDYATHAREQALPPSSKADG